MLRARLVGIAIAIAAVALPTAVLATPANAANGPFLLKEANGHMFLVGAPDLTVDSPVTETVSGRQLNFQFVQNGPSGFPEYELQLRAATTECVAAAADRSRVVLHHCDGGLGTVWIEHPPTSTHKFQYESREFRGLFLSGPNGPGAFHLLSTANSDGFHNFNKIQVPPQP